MEGSAGALKEEGDQLFKNGAIEEACERYGRALSLIDDIAIYARVWTEMKHRLTVSEMDKH